MRQSDQSDNSGILPLVGRGCAALMLMFLAWVAMAQSQVEYRSADLIDPVLVNITAFSVVGENPLEPSITRATLDPYLGPDRGIADIEEAVEQLEQKLKATGYSFYRVEVTSQELVDGEIELTVRRYRIGEIRVTGNRYYSDENIIASVPQLVKGASPSTASMSRSLRLANQNPGKRTLLQMEASSVPDQLDALIQVVDQPTKVASLWANNTGTRETGRYRMGIGLEHRNLFGRDHTINVSFITSPEDFESVQQAAVTYQLPLYSVGGKIDFLAVKSDIDTGTVAEVFDVAGRGDVLGAGYTQVLPSVGRLRHQVSARLTDKLFENDILFSGQQIGPDVRSRPMTLGYQASWRREDLATAMSIAYTKNLNGGSLNDPASYQASRNGATNRWDSYSASLNVEYQMGAWQLAGSLNYSGSSDRLITGEQFALGGVSSVRGMEERELNGDKGHRLGIELWAPPIDNRLRPVLFIDSGTARVNRPELDENPRESVLSVGAAMYWNPNPKVNISVAAAHLIDGIDTKVTPDAVVSEDGNNRLHINVAYRF